MDAAGIQYPDFDTSGISDPRRLHDWIEDLNRAYADEDGNGIPDVAEKPNK